MKGDMRDMKFLSELYEKDEKFIRIHDNYAPNYRTPPVTAKFYSIYEAIDLSTADPEIVKAIKTNKDKGPKEKFPCHVTENQVYGWFIEPGPRDLDCRFDFPRKSCSIVRLGLKLKQLDKNNKIR